MDRPRESLTSGTVNAAAYEVGAYAISVALRLGGNLILTRLLVPEAFGLMAMLNVLMFMLWLLSEVGLSQSVVMSPRGDDPVFLDTVFSLQATRGLGLWAAASLLAWPASVFFKAPELIWIIPIGSFGTAIHGLASTRIYSLRRRVRPLPVLSLDLSSSVIGLCVNVTGALLGFGVKALVASLLVTAVTYMVGSHFLPGVNYRNRFRIDPDSRHEIMHFGRWIFFSSVLTAVAQRGDQVLLGRLIGAAGLGVYNIALALAEMPDALMGNIISGVLYPTLARVRNTQPEAFTAVYYRVRRWMDPLAHVGLGGVIGLSDWIIALLYDPRYTAASGMLRVLAVRSSVHIVAACCESCFVASGDSKFSFRRNLFVSVMLLIAMPVGSAIAGLQGVLWGSVIARSMALAALWPEAHRRGFLRISRELLAIPYLGAGYALGTGLNMVLPEVR